MKKQKKWFILELGLILILGKSVILLANQKIMQEQFFIEQKLN